MEAMIVSRELLGPRDIGCHLLKFLHGVQLPLFLLEFPLKAYLNNSNLLE
jgi:hypothetical protein